MNASGNVHYCIWKCTNFITLLSLNPPFFLKFLYQTMKASYGYRLCADCVPIQKMSGQIVGCQRFPFCLFLRFILLGSILYFYIYCTIIALLFITLLVMAKFSIRNAWVDFFFLSNNSVIRAPFNRIVKIPSTPTIHPEIYI